MAATLKGRLPAGLLALLLTACSPQQDPQTGANATGPAGTMVRADILWFEEQEAGVEPYPVRVLVTPTHVRIDDGLDAGDYILFERQSATSYSVSREDRSVLEIRSASTQPAMPESLELSEHGSIDPDAPEVAGRQPVQVSISANGTVCYRLVRLPGLMQAGLSGLAEYARALGNRQLASMDRLLPEQDTPCFLARYAYAADRPYSGGIPLRMWDEAGYLRELVNFSVQDSVSSGLFSLPRDYTFYQMGGSGS